MAGRQHNKETHAAGPRGTDSPRIVRDRDPDLRDRLAVIYKYRRIGLSVFLLIILASLLRTYTTIPLYRAQTRLMIEMEDERTVAMAGAVDKGNGYYYWIDPKVYYETHYRLLAGAELGGRVVKRLNLSRVPEFAGSGPAPPSESELVAKLLERVTIRAVPNSRLADVSFVSSDPDFAALAANTLSEEYVKQNLEVRRRAITASLEWLAQELVGQQNKVEASERAMAQYREDQNAASLEEHQNIVVARLNQLNDAVTKAKTSRVEKEAIYDQVQALEAGVSAETIPAILQSPYIQPIKARLAELQRERAALLERYGDRHPNVIKVNAALRDTMQQLQEESAKAIEAIKNEYQSALTEERRLEAALEAQKSETMDLGRKNVSYAVLEREAHSNRQVYEALLLREKELQVVANSRGSNVTVTDRATTPGAPFSPTPRRDLLTAFVVAIPVTLGLVFFLNYLDDTVKNPDDVSDKLMTPLLGFTPKVKSKGQLLLSHEVPHEFGEAFRSLRTSLIFNTESESTRLVMVTSAQPLEGKTTTACNLALALAIGGARVLLIDADMRRPGVSRLLPVANRTGLSDVLTGQASMEAALVTLESPRMSVLPAGVSPRNPSELLGSQRMRTLLDDTKNGPYDWVIVDTPPVLAVTDAVVLSPLVNGIAFVVGSEMTRREHAARALETLSNNSASRVSVVLNRVDFKRNRYYYRRYYGYKHANYYDDTAPAA